MKRDRCRCSREIIWPRKGRQDDADCDKRKLNQLLDRVSSKQLATVQNNVL